MTGIANDDVIGTVSRVESQRTDYRQQILTYVTLMDVEFLKGTAAPYWFGMVR